MVPEDGQGLQACREQVFEACGCVVTGESLGAHDIEGSKRSLVSSPLSRLPARTHGERAGGLHGPIAPSRATKERLWLVVCCHSWCGRVLQASDSDGHPFRPPGTIV